VKGIVTPIYDEDDPRAFEKSGEAINGLFTYDQVKVIFIDEESWYDTSLISRFI